MESKSFAYWLQGLFELANPKSLDERQTNLIKKHLNLVFRHEIDPSFGDQQAELQEIHDADEPEVRSNPMVSFVGEKTTLEQLFGSAPISQADAMNKLSNYIETLVAKAPAKPPIAKPAPRPGTPRGPGGGYNPFDRGGRMMC